MMADVYDSSCCCGRIKKMEEDDRVGINNITHERLDLPGAFCGPHVNHTVRDLMRQLGGAEKLVKAEMDWATKERCDCGHEEGDGLCIAHSSLGRILEAVSHPEGSWGI